MDFVDNVIPVSDLQRQAGKIVSRVKRTGVPVLVTQRGRSAAVLMSAEEYASWQRDLQRLDELELRHVIAQAEDDIAADRLVSHDQVKAEAQRLRPSEQT